MKLGSVIAAGVLNDRDTIQSTGMSASRIATVLAVPQPTLCRAVVAAISGSPRLRTLRARACALVVSSRRSSACYIRSGSGGAEALDEDERDDRDADQDQHRHGRPEAE